MPARPSNTALRDLYVAYAPVAFRQARALLASDEDARDVVHEVFCRLAAGNLDAVQPRPMAYIYRATTNACLDILQSRRVRAGATAPTTADRIDSDAFHARDLLEKLDKQLDHLDRQILILWFADGLPQELIAEVLGVWRRTVGRRLRRLRAMAKELEDIPRKKTP